MFDLLQKLKEIVGENHVLTGNAVTERSSDYCHDAYGAGLLVRPATTNELSRICALAHNKQINMVPHGGLTGLVDGTSSQQGDLVVSFERLNNVIRVDKEQNILIAEAGVTLETALNKATEVGMMPGVDIPSRGSATLGGMVSTNAGGVRVLRYGMMRENILGLEAVLSDGTVLSSVNTLMKNNAGFDLKQLFIGTEGRLGFVSQVALKLHPKPIDEETSLIAAQSFETLVKILSEARQFLGSDLLSFEAMWPEYYTLTTSQPGFGSKPLPEGYPIYAVLETGRWQKDVPHRLDVFLEKMFEEELLLDAVLAKSESERQSIWRAREDSDAVQFGFPTNRSYDIGFELSDMNGFALALQDVMAIKYPDCHLFFFGHMGDGNLHVMLAGDKEALHDTLRVDDLVYSLAAQFKNSSLSAEHGIGLEKKAFLDRSRSVEEIKLMKRLAKLMGGHINAGKVVDTESD
ncbi:FAD-binding oxidoreductase [Sneathiella aquimaris]|uniref:FAD-binding oxidoreductase n=1 Tax=Sneathiella aquimaris TaxID=2599305 RepID=UPI00146E4166|nr:FAD-binding oxidoreductase [Sneathiella aquimaris]